MRKWFAAALLMLAAVPAAAQEARVSIQDASWLAGRWVGEGLGGEVEETWSPAAGGQMVGHFALVRNGAAAFYEMMILDVQPAGLRLRVKHFNPDFIGWEDKGDWHSFEPKSVAVRELRFDGLRIWKEGEELRITVTLRQKDGTVKDHLLMLRRAS